MDEDFKCDNLNLILVTLIIKSKKISVYIYSEAALCVFQLYIWLNFNSCSAGQKAVMQLFPVSWLRGETGSWLALITHPDSRRQAMSD